MSYSLPSKEENPYWPMPREYGDASPRRRKDMRLELLTAWFDPKKPGELMIRTPTGIEIFIAALNFYVNFYVKPSKLCRHQYHLPDCRIKEKLQRKFTKQRSATVAPRRSNKTFTLIYEEMPFIAQFRPYTPILIGSETKELTYEKLKEIRRRVEGNERLRSDFGITWPTTKRGQREWTNRCLDFNNGSSIQGSSIDQSTRGRGPLAGVLDDIEGKKAKNPDWRMRLMDWLMSDYMGQFTDKGTHVAMIGTINFPDSCIDRVVKNDDPENRFIGWEREIIPMIYVDESGERQSIWPERLSVPEFDRKMSGSDDEDGSVTPIGAAAAMAEFQGEPIPSGERMFPRVERKHGYLLCGEGSQRYIYDPATGKKFDFDEWFESTVRTAGMDIADTPGSRADRSAIVIWATDPDGCKWVLDAWEGSVFSEKATEKALQMGHDWLVGKIFWEKGNQARIFREAWKARQQRLVDGFHAPILVPIMTGGVEKFQRIERMVPDWNAGLIKLPILRQMDGHVPKFSNVPSLARLVAEFDTMTGDGPSGRDDLSDAAEMGHRGIDRKGKRAVHLPKGRKMIEGWEKHGINVDPMQTHESNWTPAMKKEWDRRMGTPDKSEKESVCDIFS